MKHVKILMLFCMGSVVSLSVRAESWTNVAGHAVSAELVSRKGDMLSFKRQNGAVFSLNYKALSKECQVAVDKKFPVVKLSHDEVVKQRQEKRLEQLQKKRDKKQE